LPQKALSPAWMGARCLARSDPEGYKHSALLNTAPRTRRREGTVSNATNFKLSSCSGAECHFSSQRMITTSVFAGRARSIGLEIA
jgi:hypothetical protein